MGPFSIVLYTNMSFSSRGYKPRICYLIFFFFPNSTNTVSGSSHHSYLVDPVHISIGDFGPSGSQNVHVKPFSGNCTANIKGLLRMEGMELQFCDGQQWVQVAGHSTVENSETNPALSCKDLKHRYPSASSGMYWLSPDPANPHPFLAYCEMKAFHGGWTMCYTTDDKADPKDQIVFHPNKPYGTDGYRTNCNYIPFTEVIFVDQNTDHKAYFSRVSEAPPIKAEAHYGQVGSAFGLWEGHGTVSSAYTGDYQLLICDHSFYSGFFVSGFTGNCYKQCHSWCGDTSSPYFRTAATSSLYDGVAFNVNGHHPNNVPNRLMSVGVR